MTLRLPRAALMAGLTGRAQMRSRVSCPLKLLFTYLEHRSRLLSLMQYNRNASFNLATMDEDQAQQATDEQQQGQQAPRA